eukprot:jgi/Mesvir1/12794/Mv22844-RA.1
MSLLTLPVQSLAIDTLKSHSILPLLPFLSRLKTERPMQAYSNAAVRSYAARCIPRVACAATRSSHRRRKGNSPGDFYVDTKCIDCELCWWMAPDNFSRDHTGSYRIAVTKQPSTEEERLHALQALLACPTGAICTETPAPDLERALASIPIPINGDAGPSSRLPGVYHCGYVSEKGNSAVSYLIVREGGAGNILIDTPRFDEHLAKRLDSLGGVRYMFLFHHNEMADHGAFARRFGCERIIHALEETPSTRNAEVKLEGKGPWQLPGSTSMAEDDVEIRLTRGYLQGHMYILYGGGEGALFTGDSLSDPVQKKWLKNYTWGHSEEARYESMMKLLELPFQWVLPAQALHGRMEGFSDQADKMEALEIFLRLWPGNYDPSWD